MRQMLLGLLVALFALPVLAEEPVIYVVRHAEKLAGDDPELSEQGRWRAVRLADRLADAGIERIFSTDTKRTRATAAPLAEKLGLEIELYDHRRQHELAARLRAGSETVLVVGHSNTIDTFVKALGADPGPPVGDDEYDRLYAVRLAPLAAELERYAVE